MQVNGFQIKQELKMIDLTIEALTNELPNTYSKLPEDTETRNPAVVIEELVQAEKKKALYQAAQAEYNQEVQVVMEDTRTVSLAYVIKLEGVINRMAKIWKDTAKQDGRSRYGVYEANTKYPVSQVNTKVCLEKIKELTRESSKLQGLIGVANSRQEIINTLGK